MPVGAEYRQAVLTRQGGNPEVIRRNRAPLALEKLTDIRVVPGSSRVHGQHLVARSRFREPVFVAHAVARLPDAVSVFAEHNRRQGDPGGLAQDGFERQVAVRQGRQPVRVQNHFQSSGSILPNSSAMIRSILTVSLCKDRSLPNDFIHGLSSPPGARNLSASASVTNALSGIPRSAAADFARRNSGSGISSVVFIYPDSPIFMGPAARAKSLPYPQ